MTDVLVRRIPFPFVGYVLILLGFLGLGLFVAALAYGRPEASYLGIAAAAAYGAGTACFRYRGHQMRNARPSDATVLHFDPMVPDTEQREVARYLRTYRGLEPMASPDARRRDYVPPPRRSAAPLRARRVPSTATR